MVLTDLIACHVPGIEMFHPRHRPPARGDLPPDAEGGRPVRPSAAPPYFPQPETVQQYATAANGFYQSVELRKACCQVRKVEPLGRALAGKAA